MANLGDLRVWWIRNPPSEPQHYAVEGPAEAAKLLKTFATADLRNPCVEANAGGLERYEDGPDGPDWYEWYDDETGNGIGDWEG